MKTSKISIKPPCPELRGSLAGMKYPAFVEVKKDGEFAFVHVEKGNSFTVNKEGRVRQEFNYLDAIEARIIGTGHTSATFLAELTVQDGKAGQLYDLLSQKENNELKLFVFDVLELDHKDLRDLELIDRREIMHHLLPNIHSHVHMVSNEAEAMIMFKKATDNGYEGVVVKSLTGKLILDVCGWVKIKYKDRTDYQVKAVDNVQERIEIFAPVPQGHANYPGVTVGVKCANKYKSFVTAAMISGVPVTIEHQGVLATGSLRHPVLIADPNWK